MTLARTALRLASVEALCPSSVEAGTYPTIAGQYVADSRLDPLDDLSADERRPTISVYTEEDNGDPGQGAGGPPFKRTVDLVFELAVAVLVPVDADAGQFAVMCPITDAQLEASLDLLEAQVRYVLFFGPTGALWRKMTGRRVTDIRSLPHRSGEESVPLAARSLRLKVTIEDDLIATAPTTDPTGLARLPQPLRDVIEGLNALGYGAKIGAGLAPFSPVMSAAPAVHAVVGAEIAISETAATIDVDVGNLEQGS